MKNPCNHHGFEAVTMRMQREMQGNPDPCPWCEIERLRVALEAIEKAAVSTNDFWYVATAHRALHGEAIEPVAPRELTLQDFGYAPGNYAIKCLDCGQEALGCDKRAARCETCAKQALAEIGPCGGAR